MLRSVSNKFLLPILLVLVFLAAPAAADAGNKIVKVGVTVPLSGNLAHVGTDIQRGMELALEDLKDSKTSIELVFEDNQHNPKSAASAAQKLLDVDGVDILVSIWDMADIVAPLAERRKTPHLSIRWNPGVAKDNKYTITFESTYISYTASQVELLKALGVKKLALITEESQGWVLSRNSLKEKASAAGLEVVFDETFVPENTDLLTIVTKMLAKKPDIVVTNTYQPNLDLVLKRIRQRAPKMRITGYFEAISPLSLVEGMPFVAQFQVEPWFSKKFEKRYGEPFNSRAPHGYDLISFVANIYNANERMLDGDSFLKQLRQLKNFKGASGTLSMNETDNIENTCVWQVALEGKFVPLNPKLIASYKQ